MTFSVVGLNKVIDFLDELFHASKRAVANGALSNQIEPDFDLVQPGRVGGGEMDVVARSGRKPSLHVRMFVSPVIVYDKMDVQVLWNIGINIPEKLEILLMPVTAFALAQHFARRGVQRREQRGRPMTDIIMRSAFGISDTQRQQRLRSLQGLNWTLLVHAQHQGVVGRIQVQSHNVANLFDKKGIAGQFEILDPMRLKTERSPHPMDGRFGQFCLGRHRAYTPVGPILGRGFERFPNQGGDFFIGNGTGASRTQFIVQSRDPVLKVSGAPFSHSGRRPPDLFGNVAVAQAFARQQNHSGAGNQGVGKRTGIGQRFQFLHPITGPAGLAIAMISL